MNKRLYWSRDGVKILLGKLYRCLLICRSVEEKHRNFESKAKLRKAGIAEFVKQFASS